MKTLTRHAVSVFSLSLVIIAVIFFSTLQVEENEAFASNNGRQTLIEEKLEDMRTQIQLNGWTFEVGDTPVLHERFDVSCPQPVSMHTISDSAAVTAKPLSRHDCVYTPVKNGGSGNGWAWASTAMFEKTIKLIDNVTVSLSEAWLIDCNPYGWNAGNGWFASDIFFRDGAVLSSNYTGSCTGVTISYQADGWRFCGNGYSVASTNSIKTAIVNYGAVACMVYVDYYFMAYTGGVFNHSSQADVNYFVIICGWDDTYNAWKITPSWGTGWGESGYMRIAYGCHRIGWAANYLIY
jgi:hypothetical protein